MDKGNGDVNVKQIVDNIISSGTNAKAKGVKNIFIGGICMRRHTILNYYVRQVNYILKLKCRELGFCFIDNSNIEFIDLSFDGLHLNKVGSAKISYNILRCIDSYNPYLDDDYIHFLDGI